MCLYENIPRTKEMKKKISCLERVNILDSRSLTCAQIEKISSASLYEEAPRTILGVLPNGTLVFAQV